MNNNSNLINSCNIDITDEINERILARINPISNLDIAVDSRPVGTKYTFPISVDNKNCSYIINTNNNGQGSLSLEQNNELNGGYLKKINDESVLRNQIFALQKFPQSVYVPNSNSDLYNTNIPLNNDNNVEKVFPNLFNNNIYENKKDNTNNLGNIGINLFNNHTRQQLKDN